METTTPKQHKITLSLETLKELLIQELYLIPYEETVEIELKEDKITVKYTA